MAAKRSISPGPMDLMKEILKLIAEPNSVNNKKRLEVTYFQQPSSVTDPTVCNYCSNHQGFACNGLYHTLPKAKRLFEEVRFKIEKVFNFELFPFNLAFEPFLEEVPIQRKYNVKLPVRKQLDKLKMIRKNDRCVVCRKGVLQARLVQCHYCNRLYHLNCLDPPIRDWDHSMRWICPAHEQFLELAYPDVFTPGRGLITHTITTKRMRCELPSIPVNKLFNIPSQIEALYKKPEENIPSTSTENSSLNILCDVASFALESINSNHKINSNGNVLNAISDKLIAGKNLNNLEISNYSPPIKCSATLSCLSFPFEISVQKKEITIGNSHKNDVCLLPYGHCEYISSYHATIKFDEKVGDFVLKNLSRFGIIVDNVSYFGNRRRPKDPSNNHELKKVNSGVRRHINKQRRTVQKNKIILIKRSSVDEKPVIKYASKTREFNYKPMSKYYKSKFKNIQHGYQKIQCKCSKRLIQKDGYSGFAILRNESIILIGCMRFKFSYDAGIIEILKVCSDESLVNTDGGIVNKGSHLKSLSEKEDLINLIGTRNYPDSVSNNENDSLQTADDTSSINEQNNINKLDLDNSAHCSNFYNTKVGGVSENIVLDNDDIQPMEISASETSDTECTKKWNVMSGVSSKIQCFASDLIQEVEVNESSDDDEVIEEEIVYEMNFAEADSFAPARNSGDQEWIIEEIVIEENRNYNDNKPGSDLQLTSRVGFPVAGCNSEDYKTEHMYCARSPCTETIVISDDDDDDDEDEDDRSDDDD